MSVTRHIAYRVQCWGTGQTYQCCHQADTWGRGRESCYSMFVDDLGSCRASLVQPPCGVPTRSPNHILGYSQRRGLRLLGKDSLEKGTGRAAEQHRCPRHRVTGWPGCIVEVCLDRLGTRVPRGLLCDGGSTVANSGYRPPYCTVSDGSLVLQYAERGLSSLGPSSVKMRQLSPVPCSSQSNIFDVSADDLGLHAALQALL